MHRKPPPNADAVEERRWTSKSRLSFEPYLPETPDVSAITTVLNGEDYLSEAIDSVLAQKTRFQWELWIVDDGSQDQSLRIALDYATRFPGQIQVLQHPGGVNRGMSASRNLGLRHARAEVLAFLDADDVWLPHKLESQMKVLRQRPSVAMAYAGAERWYDVATPYDPAVGSLGRNSLPPLIPEGEHPGTMDGSKLLQWFLTDESMTPCSCSVLVRTEVARRLGGFVNSFHGLYEDQAFYAKLSAEEIFVSLDCVARYRQHASSCCARARADEEMQVRERAGFDHWLQNYQAEKTSADMPVAAEPLLQGSRR